MNRIYPIKKGHISSGFGKRSLLGVWQNHGGIDIVSDCADFSVFCPVSGLVVACGYTKDFGNRVYIRVNENEYYVLAHLQSISSDVFVNKYIILGSTIGIMGNTGLSLGRHLHWGFYRNYLDPKSYYLSPYLIF